MKNRYSAYDSFSRTARALDFQDIRNLLASLCKTALGAENCMELVPAQNRLEAETLLDETGEMIEASEPLFTHRAEDPEPILKKIGRGTLPVGDDIKTVASFLQQVERLSIYLESHIPPECKLRLVCGGFEPLPEIVEYFSNTFDGAGEVKTEANARLVQLESRISSLRLKINKKAEKISEKNDVAEKLQDSYITIRNERIVLPIKAEFKNVFQGIIHGISATDKTAFMEPQELVKDNNELQEAVSEREEEIYILYRKAAQMLKDNEKKIHRNYEILGAMDAITARANFSKIIKGTRPSFVEDGTIRMIGLKHPLMTARKENPRPNILEMNSDEKTLVISGPNAGGKTVLLKAIGLAVALSSCGIFPSIDKGSSFPFVRRLFAIAGDEQSIEEHQSTFSASLLGIKQAIEGAGDGTWVIVDEILNGTDPTQAAALAETLLEYFGEKECRVFVSTHLPGIKVLAQDDPAMVNAAMGVDEKGKTTFKLTKGHPGASYPLGIAATIGLPKEIIDKAKQKLSSTHDRYQAALQDLQVKADALDTAIVDYEKKIKETEYLLEKLERETEEVGQLKKEFEREKNKKLKQELVKARGEIAAMIEEARQADTKQKKRLAGNLKQKENELVMKIKQAEAIPLEKLKEGDPVWIIPLDRKAELVRIGGDGKVEIVSGGVRMTLPAKELLGMKEGKPVQTSRRRKFQTLEAEEGAEISLLGLTGDDAIEALDKFLDSQIVIGSESVRVVHGKGVVRNRVLGYLENSGYVESSRYAESTQGGDGASIVTLK